MEDLNPIEEVIEPTPLTPEEIQNIREREESDYYDLITCHNV